VARVIERERPDALLPTLGGQTGLNTAIKVAEMGMLEQYNVEMLAANIDVIRKAEGREEFRDAMRKIGLKVPESDRPYPGRGHGAAVKSAFPSSSVPALPWAAPAAGRLQPQRTQEHGDPGLDLSMTNEVMLEKFPAGLEGIRAGGDA
jgi:carbamoyl-phosphate synthase large subunit